MKNVARMFAAAALAAASLLCPPQARAVGANDADADPAQVKGGVEAGAATGLVESRGVWLGREEMLEGKDALLARLDRLATAGINTIYINTQFRGYVLYPDSAILPQFPPIAEKDPRILDWLIPAVQERGMRAETWTEYGFFTYYTPDITKDKSRGAVLDKRPHLTAISEDGLPYHHDSKLGYFYALCSANPESHQVLADIYLEMLDKYPFDGLSIDRIRFFDRRFCHCDYCKRECATSTGLTLAKFDDGTSEAAAFQEWRKAQTREFMRNLSARVRAKHPGKPISSAVVSPDLISDKGQDWPSWMRAGYLDAAMPMLYARNISPSLKFIDENLPASSKVFYGLDAGQGWDTFSAQMTELRSKGAPGYTVWYAVTLDTLLPKLKESLFAQPAVSPFGKP